VISPGGEVLPLDHFRQTERRSTQPLDSQALKDSGSTTHAAALVTQARNRHHDSYLFVIQAEGHYSDITSSG
jgi:hypothetical protein